MSCYSRLNRSDYICTDFQFLIFSEFEHHMLQCTTCWLHHFVQYTLTISIKFVVIYFVYILKIHILLLSPDQGNKIIRISLRKQEAQQGLISPTWAIVPLRNMCSNSFFFCKNIQKVTIKVTSWLLSIPTKNPGTKNCGTKYYDLISLGVLNTGHVRALMYVEGHVQNCSSFVTVCSCCNFAHGTYFSYPILPILNLQRWKTV